MSLMHFVKIIVTERMQRAFVPLPVLVPGGFEMDMELEMMWKQMIGYSAALNDFCCCHLKGKPSPNPQDTEPPRTRIPYILKDIGEVWASIEAKEKTDGL
jgi:hypothetical protein